MGLPAELFAFAGFGAVILIVAWLPLWLNRLPLTLPMLAVGVYARRITESARRLERLLAFLVFGLFGGATASGVLGGIGWREIVFALLVVRPVATLSGFLGSTHPKPVRFALGYFGIRGIGSLYYVSRAAGASPHHDHYGLWPVTALAVLLSIALYGTPAKPVLGLLDRVMERNDPQGRHRRHSRNGGAARERRRPTNDARE